METAKPPADVSDLYNAMHGYIDSHDFDSIRNIRSIGMEIGHLGLVEWTYEVEDSLQRGY
jgi:hypothetical protein